MSEKTAPGIPGIPLFQSENKTNWIGLTFIKQLLSTTSIFLQDATVERIMKTVLENGSRLKNGSTFENGSKILEWGKDPPQATADAWGTGPAQEILQLLLSSSSSVSHLQISTELSYIAVLFIVWRVQVLGFVLRIYVFELGGAVETLLADTFASQFQDNCNWSPSCNDIFMNTFVAHRFVHVSIHLLCSTCSYYCLVCDAMLNEISWSQLTVVSFLPPMLEKHFYKSFSRKAWRIHIWILESLCF